MNSLPKTSVLSQSHVPSYSLFAQLLASERLRVTVDRRAKTASFSPEARILTLPSWSNFDNDAWLLFIAHEVGHALFTPADSFTRDSFTSLATKYGHNAVLGVANVFEDVRIERLVREKYRGLAGTFSRGYHSLMNREFFGFTSQTIVPAWASKTVLDRINIYAKVGGLLRLSLTEAQESQWFNRALRAETFDDVMVLVAEVMAQLTEQQRQQAAQAAQNNQPSQGQPSQSSQGQPSQGQPQDGQSQSDAPSQDDAQESQPQSSQSQSDAQDGSSQSQPSQDGESKDDQPSQSSQEQKAQSSQDGQSQEQTAQPSQGDPNAPSSAASSDPFTVASQQAAERSLRNSVDTWLGDGVTMLPTSTAYLHHNDRTIEQMLAEWKATPEQREFFRTLSHQQRREQSSILATMIAAFRANQAAWQSRRVQVSRSGIIDTAKLAQYKLTEDLFLRRRSLPEAQNHGFVLHVDWSGSMEGKMAVVLWQVLHLIWFAESIKVPVSVYGFSNSGTNTEAGNAYAEACRKAYRRAESGRLVELYRSNAAAQVKQDAQSFLFALVLRFSGVAMMARWDENTMNTVLNDPAQLTYHCRQMPKSLVPVTKAVLPTVRVWDYDTQRNAFYHSEVSLGGTPLHYALVSSVDTVRKFRQVHRVEQCISVWLTDGADTDGIPVGGDMTEHVPTADTSYAYGQSDMHYNRHSNGTLFDARSGRSFKVEQGRALATLFSLHRALTGATVICIDITPAPLSSFARVLSKSALSVVANSVGPQDQGYGRRRRGVVRAKAIKQTRKRVVIKSEDGTFEETGLMLVTRAQYPEIGCDAYLVTHPDWWAQRDETKEQREHVTSTSRILSSFDEEEEVALTPEEREAEQRARPVRLAAALREGAAHIAMRRFADLLVPYMAAGREDATV